ncbi:hypothetical protein MGYG_00242 [Nannizzia gypsea CBS 118893]|uniref:Uncharacterized protein n=1 Tax=Arthroderma gypseum (strain ATCC MYA-4604 / CBS 118893) TaxID=535722 RepID=E5QYA8_ARTGP|nr:hypothetical protein MGYG_00242 [Nannizzia gypsea CBS 118893]EFQ97200.1 hypothetical protein MGYG_00242 [Nannizzia gypsea CBS 118893]
MKRREDQERYEVADAYIAQWIAQQISYDLYERVENTNLPMDAAYDLFHLYWTSTSEDLACRHQDALEIMGYAEKSGLWNHSLNSSMDLQSPTETSPERDIQFLPSKH